MKCVITVVVLNIFPLEFVNFGKFTFLGWNFSSFCVCVCVCVINGLHWLAYNVSIVKHVDFSLLTSE